MCRHCACAVDNLCRQPRSPKEPLFLEGHGFTRAEKQTTAEGFSPWGTFLKDSTSTVLPPKTKANFVPPALNFTTPEKTEPPMPKNKVSDPITDQEIAFARLVLSGTMTDRHAAEAVGLNPDTAAYTKSKPRVRAYMLEHRAAVQQQLVQQEAEEAAPAEPGPRTSTGPPLGNRQPEPRNDPKQHSGQVKALSMIVAIEGLIPDRRAVSSEKKSAPRTVTGANRYRRLASRAAGKTTGPQPGPDLIRDEDGPGVPDPPPGGRQTRLRTLALPPAQTLTQRIHLRPPLAPRKRPRRRLMPPCPLLLQTTGSLPLWKRNPIPGA